LQNLKERPPPLLTRVLRGVKKINEKKRRKKVPDKNVKPTSTGN